jgi:hypothetical protein
VLIQEITERLTGQQRASNGPAMGQPRGHRFVR